MGFCGRQLASLSRSRSQWSGTCQSSRGFSAMSLDVNSAAYEGDSFRTAILVAGPALAGELPDSALTPGAVMTTDAAVVWHSRLC
jgi:hypothetical protein